MRLMRESRYGKTEEKHDTVHILIDTLPPLQLAADVSHLFQVCSLYGQNFTFLDQQKDDGVKGIMVQLGLCSHTPQKSVTASCSASQNKAFQAIKS